MKPKLLHTLSCVSGEPRPQRRKLRPPANTFPSSVVKCLWEVFAWGFGVLLLSCACVSVSGVLFSVGVCVCVTC